MPHTTRTRTTLLAALLALALAPLVGATPGRPGAPLHYKSVRGLMPPAYGMATDAPTVAAAPPFTTLGPAQSVDVGSWAQVLATGDFTHDARTSVALATSASGNPAFDEQLHLLVPNSTTLLLRTQNLPAGPDPAAIVVDDLNHDGQTDVALALAASNQVAVFMQTAGLGFASAVALPLLGGPDALASGDFNGDGVSDLAAVAPLSATIALWHGPLGVGATPALVLPFPTGGYDALAAGDLNGDGYADLVALRGADLITASLVLFFQGVGGTFPTSTTLSPQTEGFLPHSVAVGDVNGDGRDDLVVTAGGNVPAALINVFVQDVSGLNPIPVTYPAYNLPSSVAVGDINHDGRDDVVALHEAWRTLSIFTQTGTGTLAPYAVAALPYTDRYRPNALALADLDGNGGLDVAIADGTRGVTVLTNTLSAPVATITDPTRTARLSPGTLVVSGTASTQAISVEVRLRGSTNWVAVPVSGSGWQANLTLPVGERTWWIEARALDAQGQLQAPPARRRVAVENGPPQGALRINDGAAYTHEPTVRLSLPASDMSGVATMRFTLDSAVFTPWETYTPTRTWDFASGDGLKTLKAQFSDPLNNVSTLVSAAIILDTQPPTSTITTQAMTLTAPILPLTWNGGDALSGIASYSISYREDTGEWQTLLQATAQTTTTVQFLHNGRYCFRSQAVDGAGNLEDLPPGDGDVCVVAALPPRIPNADPGDCNADTQINVADIVALGLELFDGDGTLPADVPLGTFAGNSTGCNANNDTAIDVSDIVCTARLTFGQTCSVLLQAEATGVPMISVTGTRQVQAGATISIPVQLTTQGSRLAGVSFSLEYDPTQLQLELPATFTVPTTFGYTMAQTAPGQLGRVDVIVAAIAPPLAALPDGPILTLQFQARPGATTQAVSAIQLRNSSFSDPQGQRLSGSATDGTITVTPRSAFFAFLPLIQR